MHTQLVVVQAFADCVHRCLVAVDTSCSHPCTLHGQPSSYEDYSFHNQVSLHNRHRCPFQQHQLAAIQLVQQLPVALHNEWGCCGTVKTHHLGVLRVVSWRGISEESAGTGNHSNQRPWLIGVPLLYHRAVTTGPREPVLLETLDLSYLMDLCYLSSYIGYWHGLKLSSMCVWVHTCHNAKFHSHSSQESYSCC